VLPVAWFGPSSMHTIPTRIPCTPPPPAYPVLSFRIRYAGVLQVLAAADSALGWLLAAADAAATGNFSWEGLWHNATVVAGAGARSVRVGLGLVRRRAAREAVETVAWIGGGLAGRAHSVARAVLGPGYRDAAVGFVRRLRPLVRAKLRRGTGAEGGCRGSVMWPVGGLVRRLMPC
jgi:hypothetical protein